jgi:hypothetical protein
VAKLSILTGQFSKGKQYCGPQQKIFVACFLHFTTFIQKSCP